MPAFLHLSVENAEVADGFWFYAVILGLAFSQCAIDLAREVRTRFRQVDGDTFWPGILWQVFLLLLSIEVFIALTAYTSNPQQRNILDFLAFLAIPVLIFTASLLAERQGSEDLAGAEQGFSRARSAFFTVIVLMPLINFIHEFALGQLGVDLDLLFPGLILLGGLVGYVVRGRRADTILAAAMVVVIATYLGTSYSTVKF